jgi:hypothetical protein
MNSMHCAVKPESLRRFSRATVVRHQRFVGRQWEREGTLASTFLYHLSSQNRPPLPQHPDAGHTSFAAIAALGAPW